MPGRPLLPESAFESTPYANAAMAWRRQVLRETVDVFVMDAGGRYEALARRNLERWRADECAVDGSAVRPVVQVLPGDWGDVALRVIREHGEMFAVLNMANAHVPGGGYVEGMVAQEENMFRRTNCHLCVEDGQLDASGGYRPEMTSLLNGEHGRVYLDRERVRVCVRGPEVTGLHAWLLP